LKEKYVGIASLKMQKDNCISKRERCKR